MQTKNINRVFQGSSSHVNDNAPINKSGQENGTKMKNACVSINLVGGDFKAETKKEKIGDKGMQQLIIENATSFPPFKFQSHNGFQLPAELSNPTSEKTVSSYSLFSGFDSHYPQIIKSGTLTLPKDMSKNRINNCPGLLKKLDHRLSSRSVSTPVLNVGQIGSQVSNPTLSSNCSQQLQFVTLPSSFQVKTTPLNDDSLHLRDVCSKYFTRDEKSGTRPLMMNIYPQTINGSPRNFKSVVSEKVAQKDTIVKQSEVNGINNYRMTCIDGEMTIHGNVNSNQNELLNISTLDKGQKVIPDLVQDRHIVVVSCFENGDTNNLTVKTSPSSDDINGCKNDSSLNQMPSTSSQDLNYKSSSESGRGTMRSDGNGFNGSTPLDHTSLDSDQSLTQAAVTKEEKHSTTANIIEKMQKELQRILDDEELTSDVEKPSICRLPVVQESDSWVSDSTTPKPIKDEKPFVESNLNGEVKSKNNKINYKSQSDNNSKNSVKSNLRTAEKTTPTIKSSSSKTKSKTVLIPNTTPILSSKSSSKNVPNSSTCKTRKWRYSMDDLASTTTCGLDDNLDLTSEYTANTSNWDNDDVRNLRKQLPVLENMYSEIINILGTKKGKRHLKDRRVEKLNRKISGSVSSLTASIASRDPYYSKNYKFYSRRDDIDSSKGARRLKRLEGHVITLAKSVAQLSSEIRSNHCLMKEVETLRKDIDIIQEQFKTMKLAQVLEMSSLRRNGVILNDPKEVERFRSAMFGFAQTNRFDKLKRFFGDDPPLLRQFLKKLGYEKYVPKLESEKIGLKELVFLSEEKLQKLGIPMGPRTRIIQEVNKLKPSNLYLV